LRFSVHNTGFLAGDDDDEPEFSSAMPLEEGDTFFFAPRPLRNLVLVDELESLSPILHTTIADLANEDTPQIYAACGRGPRSTLRVLRHGLEAGLEQTRFFLCFLCFFVFSFFLGILVFFIFAQRREFLGFIQFHFRCIQFQTLNYNHSY
jgi:hypothetical protein